MNLQDKIERIQNKINRDRLSSSRKIPSFWVRGKSYESDDLVVLPYIDDKVYVCSMPNSDYPEYSNDWLEVDWHEAVFLRELCYLKESFAVIQELSNASNG